MAEIEKTDKRKPARLSGIERGKMKKIIRSTDSSSISGTGKSIIKTEIFFTTLAEGQKKRASDQLTRFFDIQREENEKSIVCMSLY